MARHFAIEWFVVKQKRPKCALLIVVDDDCRENDWRALCCGCLRHIGMMWHVDRDENIFLPEIFRDHLFNDEERDLMMLTFCICIFDFRIG